MKKVRWLSAAAGTAIVAVSLAMPTAAYAAGPSGDTTGLGNLSLLNGNGINLPVSVPVDLCGVGVGVLGGSQAGCQGGASSNTTVDPSGTSGGGAAGGASNSGNTTGVGNIAAANGNTVNAPVSVPISLCSVSGAVAGSASSHCAGGSRSSTTIAGSGGAGGNNGNTSGVGNISAVNGNTINAPVSAPIDACSISLAILGLADSGCRGGATTTTTINPPPTTCHGRDCAPPACHGRDCAPPACHGRDCAPPPGCVGTTSTVVPPAGGAHHRHPGGTIPGITTSGGSGPAGGSNVAGSGTPDVTTATTTSMPGNLPTTGADLAVVAAVAFGSIAAGTGAVMFARRRRTSQASQTEVSQAA